MYTHIIHCYFTTTFVMNIYSDWHWNCHIHCIWQKVALHFPNTMGPTSGPPRSCRPQMGPCWPHEPCCQGGYSVCTLQKHLTYMSSFMPYINMASRKCQAEFVIDRKHPFCSTGQFSSTCPWANHPSRCISCTLNCMWIYEFYIYHQIL